MSLTPKQITDIALQKAMNRGKQADMDRKVDKLKRKISNEHKSRRTLVKVKLTRPRKRGLRMYRAVPGEIAIASKKSGLAKSTIEYRLRRVKEITKTAGRHRFNGAPETKRLYVTPRPPRRTRKDKGKKRSVAPRRYHGAKKAYPDVEL